MMNKTFTLGLLGNPNSGKSSLFNQLTGLRQKVGNFPGVTVDKKTGSIILPNGEQATIIDFPGTYSLHPTSEDERIVLNVVTNPNDGSYPDAIVYVASVMQLEKHLLLFTQLQDLHFPMILVLTMSDVAKKQGIETQIDTLSKKLNCPVILLSNRTGEGIPALQEAILHVKNNLSSFSPPPPFFKLSKTERQWAEQLSFLNAKDSLPYRNLLCLHHFENLHFLDTAKKEELQKISDSANFSSLDEQVRETMARYDDFTPIVRQTTTQAQTPKTITDTIDTIVMHRIWGPIIFFGLMLFVFQAIFTWASYPMDWIEMGIGAINEGLRQLLPAGWMTNLLTEGVIAGLGGVLVFVPIIAILFFLITLLEAAGYMARAVFMFDSIMQKFGLNGRSIVALISGGACAIPAVMSARTISNSKERLITILVTPLISCSARIPVYVVLIGFVVPATTVLGIFSLQALAFMGLYLLGIVAALFSAYVFHKILKTQERSFLTMQLPEYRRPQLRTVLIIVWEKVKIFTLEAGRIILVISIILWLLATYGPAQKMEEAKAVALATAVEQKLDEQQTDDLVAAKSIEASYVGHIGKFIEPVIRPLGFDWKIGIALVTSFAAREVFVGTMATIYSIGSTDEEFAIRDRMAKEVYPDTGKPVYTLATSLSLLLFYVFAMQCMSTLAVVKRETNGWKWPMVQFLFMSAMAYFSSLAAYQLLS